MKYTDYRCSEMCAFVSTLWLEYVLSAPGSLITLQQRKYKRRQHSMSLQALSASPVCRIVYMPVYCPRIISVI